jgi:signal transduction histidine kinase
MKLVNKTILYYTIISLPLLIIAGFISYYLIKVTVNENTDEALWKEKLRTEQLIILNPPKTKVVLSIDSLSSISPIIFQKTNFLFFDSLIYDEREDEKLNYRFLKSYYTSNHQTYLITIAKNSLEEDDLLESLFSAFAIVLIFLMLAFFVLNWFISKTLWKPFYKTLRQLNGYDLKDHAQTHFNNTSTQEFNQLNAALNQMTQKIHLDFMQQKEFTENASHEMQTPLAIIKTNLGLLMQSPRLESVEMNQLQSIDNTVKKLSSLNKALLLLSKIENQQFKDNVSVSINQVLTKTLSHFEDLIIAKHLQVETRINGDIALQINPTLMDVLMTNLIQNAIRHNSQGGKIHLQLTNSSFTISNTGQALTIKPTDLFVRFKKNDASKESLGLGLSIAQSICKVYKLSISYSYSHALHHFTLTL